MITVYGVACYCWLVVVGWLQACYPKEKQGGVVLGWVLLCFWGLVIVKGGSVSWGGSCPGA